MLTMAIAAGLAMAAAGVWVATQAAAARRRRAAVRERLRRYAGPAPKGGEGDPPSGGGPHGRPRPREAS